MARHFKGASLLAGRELIAVVLAFVMVVGGGSIAEAEMTRRENQAQQDAADRAAAAQTRLSLSDLVSEARLVTKTKAAYISEEYQAAYDAAQKNTAAGATATYTPPSASFSAARYGYSGADNLSYWRSINSDVVAWVRIPGTNINYPVVQNTQDLNYYTHRGYYKEASHYGVIWTNTDTRTGDRNNISSNTVLYGHNWKNCSASPRAGYSGDIMFEQLTGYHWLSTAQSSPYIYYSTASDEMTFVIFACFYTELSFNYNVSEGNIGYIISEAKARSRHTFDVAVNSSDKILTLSTCTRAYGNTSNQRFVVMARLLRPGESIAPITVTSNPSHKQPSVW